MNTQLLEIALANAFPLLQLLYPLIYHIPHSPQWSSDWRWINLVNNLNYLNK